MPNLEENEPHKLGILYYLGEEYSFKAVFYGKLHNLQSETTILFV